jgi:DNA uptake protein ComE-like DNA-binding protein
MMLRISRLPLGLFALIIAGPVLAQSGTSTTSPAPAMPAKPSAAAPQAAVTPMAAKLDLNSASAAELKALPGVSDAEAGKIVQGRPYKDPSDLVTKKILSEAEFGRIKDRLTAGHPKS